MVAQNKTLISDTAIHNMYVKSTCVHCMYGLLAVEQRQLVLGRAEECR